MKNAYTIEGHAVKIQLNRKGENESLVAIIDLADLEKVQAIDGTFYPMEKKGEFLARCDVKQEDGHYKLVQLHRLIAGTPAGQKVVFIDGDGLNCRRRNLVNALMHVNRKDVLAELERITPPPKSKVRGVSLHRASGTWYASAFWPPKEKLKRGEEQKRYSSYWPTMQDAEAAMNKFRKIGPEAFKKPSRKERAVARKLKKQEEVKNG
jgi:hypothetical protein